jgi:Luciferase
MPSILESVTETILNWPGTTQGTHRFGGVEFRAYGHEIGHLHGNRQADLPFPVSVREELVASGRASPHHILPQTGWVTFYIRGQDDLPALIELFRLSYERFATAEQRRQANSTETEQHV